MSLSRGKPLERRARLETRKPLERGTSLKAKRWGTRPKKKVASWRDAYVLTVMSLASGATGRTPYERALAQFVRTLPCVVCGRLAREKSLNEASHCALNADQKGMGMRVPHVQVAPKCRIHHGEWEERRGFCRGWTRQERYDQAALWIREVELAVTPEDRDQADELSRWLLGRIIGDGGSGWSWLPGYLTEVPAAELAL